MRHQRHPRTGAEYARTSVVLSGPLLEVFEALSLLEERRPSQLATQIVLEHLIEMEQDLQVRQLVRALRRSRLGLTVVGGTSGQPAGGGRPAVAHLAVVPRADG